MSDRDIQMATIAISVIGLVALLGILLLAAFGRTAPESLNTISSASLAAIAAMLPGISRRDPPAHG